MNKFVLVAIALTLPAAAIAQNSPSGSPRVQGAPAGFGDPVQVVVREADGSALVSGVITQPYSPFASQWRYTNGATGILSNTTTAVTIKAAAGGVLRNYITSCQINTTAFGAAAVLVIRDGASGTVLWANNVPTAGWLTPVNFNFTVPLRGTANTLLEVATATANTSGTAFVNCQGFTGA